MALPETTGSIPDPDQDGAGVLNHNAVPAGSFAFSAIPTIPMAPGYRPLAVAVVISIVINLGLLYGWGYFYLPTLSEKPEILNKTMQVRLRSTEPAKPVPLEEQPLMEFDEPEPVPDADTPATAEPIDEPVMSPATPLQEPEAVQPSAEANLTKLLGEPTILLPTDANVAAHIQNRSSSQAFENVFDPKLRRKLRTRERETSQSPDTVSLNRSTAEDSDQRVAMGEKCFRLEDASGGRMTQKIWYRAKCRDYDDESETMKRAIQSGLRQ